MAIRWKENPGGKGPDGKPKHRQANCYLRFRNGKIWPANGREPPAKAKAVDFNWNLRGFAFDITHYGDDEK